MTVGKGLYGFDYIVSYTFTGRVDMVSGIFLPESGTASRYDDQNHIAVGGIDVMWVAAFECAAGRTASAVIIYDHRIFFGWIEIGRKDVAHTDAVAARCHKRPSLALSEAHTLKAFGAEVFDQILASVFQTDRIESVGIRRSLTGVDEYRSCG